MYEFIWISSQFLVISAVYVAKLILETGAFIAVLGRLVFFVNRKE